jgi:hypothetical protein
MKTVSRLLLSFAGLTILPVAAAAQTQDKVTFSKDVAPILQQKCQACHHPGTVAPMSLLTYQQARPWAQSIKQKVAARQMPPWFIDKNVGIQHFEDDESLTDQQIATLVKWVDDGAIEGNPSEMPAPRQFADDQSWIIGQPDVVVTLPRDVIVKSRGGDWWPDVLVDPKLGEDRYIQAVQIIPTKGYNVIHHIRSSMVRPGDLGNNSGGQDGQLEVGEQGVWLSEYAIGKTADVFTDGSGRFIKAGTKINFQFHLHPNGTETPVNVKLGLKFYPKGYTPQHTINTIAVGAGNTQIDIRPHEANVRSDGFLVLAKPARILSIQPHMHNRGKALCMEVIYPSNGSNGNKRETETCMNFEFNWMRNYVYSADSAPLLPAGAVIHTIMWHDNTPETKSNPDPDAQITWGNRSVDEMGHAYLNMYYMSDEDYKKEVEARKAKASTLTSTLAGAQ